MLPITYDADRAEVERLLLAAAAEHAVPADEAARSALRRMRSRYAMADASLEPAVYWRITDNWLELSLRFLVPNRGVREIKDRMSRDILTGLDAAGVGIASATYDIVGVPPLVVRQEHRAASPSGDGTVTAL